MTLKECYDAMGGNYESVIGRLRKESMVQKFVLRFPNEDTFDVLKRSMAEGDYETAFRAAHTIKGNCLNLSFDRLYRSSNLLTESLREGYHPGADEYLRQVEEDYKVTVDAIRKLQG